MAAKKRTAQEERAQRMHRHIEKLIATQGEGSGPRPESPRDFIHRKMREDAAKAKKNRN